LELDAAIVGDTSTKTAARADRAATEAGVDTSRLAELWGVEITDKSTGIEVIDQIVEHHREREVKPMLGKIAAAPHAATAATGGAHAHTAATRATAAAA
jgi:hypothetical protein